MEARMITTMALIDDAAAMARFLAPIPDGDQLAKLLEGQEPVSSRAYEDGAETARFVESDGRIVNCFTISGITIDQAELIAIERERMALFSESEFRQVVERALAT